MHRAVLMITICVACGYRRDDPPMPEPPEAAAETSATAGAPSDEIQRAKDELAALPAFASVRADFKTTLVSRGPDEGPAEAPPPRAPFILVKYAAAPGELSAYLTKDPGDDKRHPAIIWLTGGDTNSIGDVWTRADPTDDQTAAAYRKAGLVMIFPSQRGGNDNPGRREGFYGEVEDVMAARDHLAALPYVDPSRIYLGGHSTGGTLALLVAETTDQFRATFAFGPVADVRGYGGDLVYCDPENENEMVVRSPMYWLASIRTPTFVFEGSDGNAEDLALMRELNSNPLVGFYEVRGTDHFGVLAPTNALIASKLIADVKPTPNFSFDLATLERPFE